MEGFKIAQAVLRLMTPTIPIRIVGVFFFSRRKQTGHFFNDATCFFTNKALLWPAIVGEEELTAA